MRTLTFLISLFFCAFLTGCVKYQNVFLASNLPEDPDTGRYYAMENDVKVDYNFFGMNMPVTTRIYNYSQEGIYVDLRSSVYLQNDQVVGRVQSPEYMEMEMVHYNPTYSQARGIMHGSGETLFIPPGSFAEISAYPFLVDFDPSKSHTRNYAFADNGQKYGISYRVSHQPDFSDAWDIAGEFTESSIYNYSREMYGIPFQSPKNYVTMKGRKVPVGKSVFAGALFISLIALSGNE